MELLLETQFWSLLTKCIIFNVNYCNDQSVHANITGNANQISTLKLPQPTAPSHNLWFPYVSLLLQYIIHANSNSIFQWNHSLFHFHDFVCLMFSCLFGLFFLDSFLLFGFIIFPDNNTPCDTKNKSFWVIWMDGWMDVWKWMIQLDVCEQFYLIRDTCTGTSILNLPSPTKSAPWERAASFSKAWMLLTLYPADQMVIRVVTMCVICPTPTRIFLENLYCLKDFLTLLAIGYLHLWVGSMCGWVYVHR